MSNEFKEALRKLSINLDTGKPFTDDEWKERDLKVQAERERVAFEERSAAWQIRKTRLIERGLASRHLGELFAKSIEETPAMDAVRKLESDSLCVMSGNVGCGKTFAAHAWLLDAMNVEPLDWKSHGIRMVTASWFARSSRYSEKGNKFSIGADRKLVIDDLGVEYADSSQSFLVDLDELLDQRWRNGLATLVTTNLTSEDFKLRYGQRIYDRCRGRGRWKNVKHESMRGST